MIEVYLFKYFFESHNIYEICYHRQKIFNQLNIMVSTVDIIGLRHNLFQAHVNYGTWSIDFDLNEPITVLSAFIQNIEGSLGPYPTSIFLPLLSGMTLSWL